MVEQSILHVYYKVSFYKYDENGDPELIGGQYIEKHLLEENETLNYLATFHFQLNNYEMINLRIERKEKRIETEFNHFERPMEALHDGI